MNVNKKKTKKFLFPVNKKKTEKNKQKSQLQRTLIFCKEKKIDNIPFWGNKIVRLVNI